MSFGFNEKKQNLGNDVYKKSLYVTCDLQKI